MRLLLPPSVLRILLNKRNYILHERFIVYLIPTEECRDRKIVLSDISLIVMCTVRVIAEL